MEEPANNAEKGINTIIQIPQSSGLKNSQKIMDKIIR